MKNKFSTSWNSSIRPSKQRKYLANAPLHIKRKLLSCNLSKDLRKKYNKRSIPLRKGDEIKIMKGKYKKKQGKITQINIKSGKIYIEGIQVKKQDGSKVNVPIRASNMQIITLNTEDKKRFKQVKLEKEKKIKENKK